jgi:hypothetical protein
LNSIHLDQKKKKNIEIVTQQKEMVDIYMKALEKWNNLTPEHRTSAKKHEYFLASKACNPTWTEGTFTKA